ncbi:hypothetical protein CJ030_MR2G013148 [Morella rubra]|uniref:Uncharacterized protein n=1 Tax=Morella rubra TaxID=262757 RepID=A0A6A1W834_9ROSI|nr:hypothetical protein CJ030_MR2G013148 [Morella rubra]
MAEEEAVSGGGQERATAKKRGQKPQRPFLRRKAGVEHRRGPHKQPRTTARTLDPLAARGARVAARAVVVEPEKLRCIDLDRLRAPRGRVFDDSW